MNVYCEYSVAMKATRQEKTRLMLLWVVAFVFLGLSLLWWVFIVAAILCAAAAIWYGPRLNYEMEYILSDEELTIDRIINQSKRKRAATLDLHSMALLCEDKSSAEGFLSNPKVKKMNFSNTNFPIYYLVMDTKDGKVLYIINLDDQMSADLRRLHPDKVRLLHR